MSAKRNLLDAAFLQTLEAIDLYVHQPENGQGSGLRRSRAYGSSTEFADYRDYAPGDDLRRIDWNLAGRFDRYYIRRFHDEKQGRHCIYIDQSASMGMDEAKATAALQLAAALGYLAVSNMDAVSFRLLRGDRCAELCGWVAGRERFYAAVRQMEALDFGGDTDLGAALRDDRHPGYDDGMSFILSDFLTDSDWKGAADALLARRRECALMQVLSPEEAEPSLSGPCRIIDAERGGAALSMDVDRSARRAYREAVRWFQEEIRRFCVSRGMALLTMRSDEPVGDALLKRGFAEGLIR